MLLRTLLLLALLCKSGYLSGQNYYVATDGNNSNPGTLTQPWATIQYALSTAGGGSDIWVRGGTYNEKLVWGASGSSGNPTTLSSYNGETVIVSGTGITEPEAMLGISSKSHISVQGLTFRNNYRQDARGIYIVGQGTGINISDCVVENIGFTNNPATDPNSVSPAGQAHGILVNGRTSTGYTNVQITGCTLRNLITGNSEALTFVGNNNGFTVSNNLLHDNTNIGIDIAGHYSWAVDGNLQPPLNQSRNGVVTENTVYNHRRFNNIDAPPGLYADGSRDVLFERNLSYSNGVGLSIGCENTGQTASNIIARNNLIYNNDQNGIVFGSNNGQIENCVFRNNSALKNGSVGMFYSEIFLQNSSNCTIANNVLYARSNAHYAIGIFSYTANNLTLTHQVHYRTGGSATDLIVAGNGSTLPTGTNILNANPLFADDNASNPDLHLQAGSPAVNYGNNSFLVSGETDFEGDARLLGAQVDCGADERQAPVAVEYTEALEAVEAAGLGIVLKWVAIVSPSAGHTEVEHSPDGLRWSLLKKTTPAAKSALDEFPYTGVNYYRLKQVDVFGNFAYSNIASCLLSRGIEIQASPNPGKNQLHVRFSDKLPTAMRIEVRNAQGTLMESQTMHKGDASTTIHNNDWPSGVYIIHANDGRTNLQCRWIKE